MKRILLFVVSISFAGFFAHAQDQDKQTAGIEFCKQPVSKASLKKTVVRLYPNPSAGKLSLSASTTETLHFYIFDLEGTLVYQTVLRNKDKRSIEDLKKGTYLYDVFEKDQSIEEGKIIIK